MEVTFFLTCENKYWFLKYCLKIGKVSYDMHGARQKKRKAKNTHSTQPRWQKRARCYLEIRSRSNVNGAYAYGKTQICDQTHFSVANLSLNDSSCYLWLRIAPKISQEFRTASLDVVCFSSIQIEVREVQFYSLLLSLFGLCVCVCEQTEGDVLAGSCQTQAASTISQLMIFYSKNEFGSQ